MSVDPLSIATSLLHTIAVRVQNVKVYQQRCRNLISRCNHLINALTEDNAQATPIAAHADALNEAQAILEIIRNRVEQWANMNTARSLLNQGAISEGIDEFHRRVDTCIEAYQVRITRQLARAQLEQVIAAQRDNSEIRESIHNVLQGITQYISNSDTLPRSGTFQTVFKDIEEETCDNPSSGSVRNAIPEENSDLQSSISQSDSFDQRMRRFCRSLVNLELTNPTDVIIPARPPRGSRRSLYSQPPTRTSSRFSITSLTSRHWRSSSVPQIAPLDLGEEITIWPTGQFMSMAPSSPTSERFPSSGRTPAISRSSIFTHGSQRSIAPRPERQSTQHSSILSTFNESEPLSPLKLALTTRDSVWKSRGRPPIITEATMEGLIHYLLLKTAEEDTEQRDTFFIAHPAFVAPLYVLGMLIRRFDDAWMCPDDVCYDIQARVMRLIRDWLNDENVIIADDVLTEMRQFIINVNNSNHLDELILEVFQGIRQKTSANFPPPTITSSFSPGTDPTPTAHQLAIALAKLEWEKYQRILPIEYTAYAGKLSLYYPNLAATIALHQLIGNWVQWRILDSNTLGRRSEIKQFFIRTAKACQTIGNFSSLGAIMEALQSDDIQDLALTHSCVPLAERRDYEKLADFLKPDNNYRMYRRALQNCELNGCIPWHVVHLHDIRTVLAEKDVDDQHEPPLLNFQKWAHLKHEAVSALRHSGTMPFTYEEDLGMAMEYLKKGLQGVSAEENISEVIQRNSAALRRVEDNLRRRRGSAVISHTS